jgi:excinuclease ABC subunit C
LELDVFLPFESGGDGEFFAALPSRPAVCLVEISDANAEPLLIRTQDLRRRLQRLLGPPDPTSKRLNLRGLARGVRYRVAGSTFEQTLTYYQNAKKLFPQRYRDLLRLRPPAVLKVSLRNAYPRCYVTRHISVDGAGEPSGGTYYGPFPSRRAALGFANRALDFFKIRRCQIKIRRDPTFPGCLYSEMKMCLAPCFKGCTDAEYSGEVTRVRNYLDSRGQSLVREMAAEREGAAQNLAFEEAAGIHARIEKLKPLLSGLPEIVGRIDRLAGLVVQPAAEANSVALFRIQLGRILGPQSFLIQPPEHTKSQSMESRVEACLALAPPSPPASPAETMEHLAILKRWFYRSSRLGEIFVADEKGQLPMRRVVRGIGRVWRGEKEETGAVP